MRIAIVDDEKEMQEIAAACVSDTLRALGAEAEVSCYGGAEAFVADWLEREAREPEEGSFCILDIEMPGVQGIELGKQIKERREEIAIIFLTSYDKFALQSYEAEAYQYILKSRMGEKLPEAVTRLVKRAKKAEGAYRVVERGNKVEKLLYRDVLYVKKDGKYVVFVTAQEEIRERTTLESVHEELEQEGFVVIERGFVANIRHIARIDACELYLDSGEKLYIGRRLVPEVKRAVALYWRSH